MPRKKPVRDPHADREAENYEKPIPSREYILEHLEERGKPATHHELCTELLLFDADSQEALRRRLNAMIRDGQLITNRRGLFALVDKMDLVKGKVQGHKDGFGFVIPDDGSDDLYLSPRQMRQVFDGDRVLARIAGTDRRGRREGKLVEVLERRTEQVVGRFYREAGVGIVVPQNRRITQEILIPGRKHKKAGDGDFVVVKITQYPHERHKASGEVVEVLGDHATPGMELEVTLRVHDIPHEWPKEVLSSVKRIPAAPTQAEIDGRIDLRELPFVTIDGEDAKDFDDAVYCKKKRGGWTLYVAIADVSHYVRVDSPLDEEAAERGNSVYFPGHVVPMLPEALSNGLCSLVPHEDRLTMVCEVDISKNGEIDDYRFYEGVINSHARLTYTEVAAMLQPARDRTEKHLKSRIQKNHADILPELKTLYSLYKKLKKARETRGALDFDTVETRIVFSEDRKIKEIIPVERNDAHRLIEECMLCANVATAEFLLNARLPALFRVHEGPDPEKVDNLYDFLREMGIGISRKNEPTPADYQEILRRLKSRPNHHILQTVVIRSLKQAMYQPENLGHFGLGYDAYTHFTSPIRRYPDLLVHRAIRYLIRNPKRKTSVVKAPASKPLRRQAIYPYTHDGLEELGEHLSVTERRADTATYDLIDWFKCDYMREHIGEEYEGTVVSVTSFGLFVELNDIYIDGLVHVTALDNDYYHFDPAGHSLTGERSGMSYHLGDQVTVVVARVDVDDRKVDLQLTGGGRKGTGRAVPKRTRSSRRGSRSGGKNKEAGKSGSARPGNSKTKAKAGAGSRSRGRR